MDEVIADTPNRRRRGRHREDEQDRPETARPPASGKGIERRVKRSRVWRPSPHQNSRKGDYFEISGEENYFEMLIAI